MSNIIKIAYHPGSKRYVHVDDAANGLACNCFCVKCEERLEAKQGSVRESHFAHYSKSHCEGSPETAIHELAKQIVVENSRITLPNQGEISYSKAVTEKALGEKIPDITAEYNGQPIYFEIYVTHAVDSEKEMFFKRGKHRSVEIDLSNNRNFSYRELESCILHQVSNKNVIYWEEDFITEDLGVTSKNWISRNLHWLFMVLALIGFIRLVNANRKS